MGRKPQNHKSSYLQTLDSNISQLYSPSDTLLTGRIEKLLVRDKEQPITQNQCIWVLGGISDLTKMSQWLLSPEMGGQWSNSVVQLQKPSAVPGPNQGKDTGREIEAIQAKQEGQEDSTDLNGPQTDAAGLQKSKATSPPSDPVALLFWEGGHHSASALSSLPSLSLKKGQTFS